MFIVKNGENEQLKFKTKRYENSIEEIILGMNIFSKLV